MLLNCFHTGIIHRETNSSLALPANFTQAKNVGSQTPLILLPPGELSNPWYMVLYGTLIDSDPFKE